MKERAKQLADEHWDYISSLLDNHGTDDTTMEIIGFHYNSAAIHFHGHGVEDERNRARATSAAAFENAAPITAYAEAAAMDTSTGYLAFAANATPTGNCDTCKNSGHCWLEAKAAVSGGTDMTGCKLFDATLPPPREPLDLRLPSYALPCTLDEICEKLDEEVLEWKDTPDDSLAELLEAWDCVQVAQTYVEHGGNDYEINDKPAQALKEWHDEGRDVMKAKKITMIKLAARAKYSPADCARILADV